MPVSTPSIVGWSHVAISVTDLERTVGWYGEVLGFVPLFPYDTEDFARLILRHPSGVVLSVTQHEATAADDVFDPARVGLDHLSLRAEDLDQLHAWAAHLDGLGIAHGGVQESAATGSALIAVHDPDGIQVELYVQTARPGS